MMRSGMLSWWFMAVGLLSLLPWTAQACSCAPVPLTLQSAFQSTTIPDVILYATLLKQTNTTSEFRTLFSAKINRVWKGCKRFKGLTTTTITTATNTALCGVPSLKVGGSYFFSGIYDASTKSVAVNLCGFNIPWDQFTTVQRNQVETLSKIYTNCSCPPGSCGPRPGAPNVRCADGVTIGGPGKCSYNLLEGACGWDIVKCPSCQKQSDCLKGQFCSTGKCRALGTCGNFYDCWNPNNKFVKNCTGAPTCTNSKCALNCARPCLGNATVVKCVANPCATTTCNTPHSSCFPNYCGSCRAIFFNSSGFRVCN